MEFKCSICDYTTPYKIAINKHFTKQNKCGDNPHIIEVKVDIRCEYCDKSYKTKDNLTQHHKICKNKKTSIEKELEQVKKELQELKQAKTININNIDNSNNSTTTSTTSTTNNIINNHFTIQLRPYNDPRLPDDIDDIYEDALEQQSIPIYLERVHFSEDYPENHNLCITNLRSRLAAKVFNGVLWETKDQEQLLDEIVNNVRQMLNKWVKSDRKRIERYKNTNLIDKDTKTNVKILLYDSYKNGIVDIKTDKQLVKKIDE